MLLKMRVTLPVLAVSVAGALMANNALHRDTMMDPAWRRADIQICYGLNAPATLVSETIIRTVPKLAPDNVLVERSTSLAFYPLVALLWYCVGFEIDRRRRVTAPAKSPASRWAAALLLVCLGTALALWGILVRRQFGFPVTMRATLFSVPYFAWAACVVSVYGHDLWVAVVSARTHFNIA
jgi:hypothetical protein